MHSIGIVSLQFSSKYDQNGELHQPFQNLMFGLNFTNVGAVDLFYNSWHIWPKGNNSKPTQFTKFETITHEIYIHYWNKGQGSLSKLYEITLYL